MPLPRPNKGESKNKFLNRCMSNDVMKEDFKDNKQRIAICYSQWKDYTKAAKENGEVLCDSCGVNHDTKTKCEE